MKQMKFVLYFIISLKEIVWWSGEESTYFFIGANDTIQHQQVVSMPTFSGDSRRILFYIKQQHRSSLLTFMVSY